MPITRPNESEYPPYYATYVNKVPEGDLIRILENQIEEYRRALSGLSEEQALHRYAAGKWTVKEVVGHVVDSERVFAYRALRIARADATPLPGFDENYFVANAAFDNRPLSGLLDEFEYVRRGNVLLFGSFSPQAAERSGTANGLSISVRAIAFITAGHAAHHLGLLREKYL